MPNVKDTDWVSNTSVGFRIKQCFSIMLIMSCSGWADEANEGAAGEEPAGGVTQEPWDRHTEEGPAKTGGAACIALNYSYIEDFSIQPLICIYRAFTIEGRTLIFTRKPYSIVYEFYVSSHEIGSDMLRFHTLVPEYAKLTRIWRCRFIFSCCYSNCFCLWQMQVW